MMDKWGLQSMASFDQKSVKSKERFPIEEHQAPSVVSTPTASAPSTQGPAVAAAVL